METFRFPSLFSFTLCAYLYFSICLTLPRSVSINQATNNRKSCKGLSLLSLVRQPHTKPSSNDIHYRSAILSPLYDIPYPIHRKLYTVQMSMHYVSTVFAMEGGSGKRISYSWFTFIFHHYIFFIIFISSYLLPKMFDFAFDSTFKFSVLRIKAIFSVRSLSSFLQEKQ